MWYYYDKSGNKIGPFKGRELRLLALQGTITPDTVLEGSDGRTIIAGKAGGLPFPEAPPLSQPDTSNPFDTDSPATNNPFDLSGEEASSPGFFDIRFTRFITNVWISIIWCTVIAFHFLGYSVMVLAILYMMATADTESARIAGFLFLLLGTVGWLLSLLFSRMGLEFIIVVFRIETHLRTMKEVFEREGEQ